MGIFKSAINLGIVCKHLWIERITSRPNLFYRNSGLMLV